MQRYYDVVLENEIKKYSVFYLADSFSVDENRILKIKSREFGDVANILDDNDRIIVSDLCIKDEFDDLYDDL